MKTFSTKEFVSFAVIVVLAVVFALAVLGAATMVATGNEFLLLALTLCGAVLSWINGFGRRTVKANSQRDSGHGGSQSGVALTS